MADFRLAYDEAVRALRAQADEHGSLRTRAGTILATSLVVTSFFGGQAVARNMPASSLAWLAVIVLSLLGLGIMEPTPSWGNMLQKALDIAELDQHPWVLWPGLFIFLAVIAFNLVGDALRDAVDPKRARH